MKIFIVSVLLYCIVYCNAQYGGFGPPPRSTGPTFPRPQRGPIFRARREANPQDRGSVNLGVTQPLGGPNRQPSIDLNYNQHILQDHRGNVDAYGGANYNSGRLTPHAGLKFERNYKNGFIGGYGQVQPGPRGRVSPTFGAQAGFRF